MLPSTLDMVPSPSTWNPRPSNLDKKIDSSQLGVQNKDLGGFTSMTQVIHSYAKTKIDELLTKISPTWAPDEARNRAATWVLWKWPGLFHWPLETFHTLREPFEQLDWLDQPSTSQQYFPALGYITYIFFTLTVWIQRKIMMKQQTASKTNCIRRHAILHTRTAGHKDQ